MKLTAEAPAQEFSVEPTKPEAAEVVEIKLTTYNPKKFGHAPVSLNPKVSIKVGIRRPTNTHLQRCAILLLRALAEFESQLHLLTKSAYKNR